MVKNEAITRHIPGSCRKEPSKNNCTIALFRYKSQDLVLKPHLAGSAARTSIDNSGQKLLECAAVAYFFPETEFRVHML